VTIPFDIFQTDATGNIVWRESAATLHDAKARIRKLGTRSLVEYVVLNQKTGDKVVIRPDLD
jgi:hypothetical protein